MNISLHVVKNANSGWCVKKTGSTRCSYKNENKLKCIQKACELAYKKYDVFLHLEDGRISDKINVENIKISYPQYVNKINVHNV